jgi:Zn-dependent protease
LESAIVSISGPIVNLALWLIPLFIIKKIKNRKYIEILGYTSKINMFLFIFNMLPIPGFDGFHFFRSLFQAVF